MFEPLLYSGNEFSFSFSYLNPPCKLSLTMTKFLLYSSSYYSKYVRYIKGNKKRKYMSIISSFILWNDN